MLALPLLFLRVIVRPILCCLLRNRHLWNGRKPGITVFSPALEPLLRIWPSGLSKESLGVEWQVPGGAQDRPSTLKAGLFNYTARPILLLCVDTRVGSFGLYS